MDKLQTAALIIFLTGVILFIFPTKGLSQAAPVCPAQSSNPRVVNGLITSPTISNNFGNSGGQCAISNQTTFASFKIPAYEDLKSTYYTLSRTGPGKKLLSTSTNFNPVTTSNDGTIINYNSSQVNVNMASSYSGTQVAFIDHDLNIQKDIKVLTTDPTKGLVLVVGGDVYIDPSVTQIDAVIISSGTIYTAASAEGTCTASSVATSALTVNGSLVSLDNNKQIVFCRTLADNSTAAEKVNQQPKYLVILKDFFADTLQKWSEIQ